MKVAIDERGLLTISPETPLEAFALRAWADKNIVPGESTSNLLVDFNLPKESSNAS